jgi:predicted nucleic acid-binding protein
LSDPKTLLDADTLSEIARGHVGISARATRYLAEHGRLTLSAVTVFERLRGYRSAIARGRPYELHLRRFVALAERCEVIPVDASVADHAARIWSGVGARQRGALLDLLVVASASARGLAVATRNARDFVPLAKAAPSDVPLVDWAR